MTRWSRVWRYARPVVSIGLLALAAVVLLGRKGELSGTASYFGQIDVGWVVLGLAAEALSMVCFALIGGRLLQEARAPLGVGSLLAISLAGYAVANSLPAGPAFGAAYAFRRYQERRVPDIVAGWVVLAVTVLGAAALAVIASVGLMAALGQGTALDLVGVTIGSLLVTAALLAVVREPQVLASATGLAIRVSRAVVRRPRALPDEVTRRVRDRLSVVTPSWPGLWIALGWALGNWVLDLACLVCAFGAVDSNVPWRGLLLAYGAAQLAANLPITPGGLGVVEGSLTIGLVAYGGAQASSVAAVLVYRLISFWALLIVGWVVVGGLALSGGRRRSGTRAALEEARA